MIYSRSEVAGEWEYYANELGTATAMLTQRDDGIQALLGGAKGGKHISSGCENGERKLRGVTPLLPFGLSELSLSVVEEMKSDDMLFVSQTKTSGSVHKWC